MVFCWSCDEGLWKWDKNQRSLQFTSTDCMSLILTLPPNGRVIPWINMHPKNRTHLGSRNKTWPIAISGRHSPLVKIPEDGTASRSSNLLLGCSNAWQGVLRIYNTASTATVYSNKNCNGIAHAVVYCKCLLYGEKDNKYSHSYSYVSSRT
jgi:hypothetical protein